jgi:hypothetical protein
VKGWVRKKTIFWREGAGNIKYGNMEKKPKSGRLFFQNTPIPFFGS